MARRRYNNTVIECARFDKSIRVATPNEVLAPVGINCWISYKGVQKKCKINGKSTTCFPYLHLEHDISYPPHIPRYRSH
jgi:hypothetical protein